MTEPPPSAPEVTPMHVVAFAAEVMLIGAFAWTGWLLGTNTVLSVVFAILLPSLAMTVWGIWCAPRAKRRLAQVPRWALKGLLFVVAFVPLIVFAPEPGAVIFGAVMLVLFAVSLPADRSLS